jgi:hypothetical protein
MTDHKTGTREEWLAGRLELLKAEKDLTRRSDELAQWRQRLPWVRIDKEYRFETDEGMHSLSLRVSSTTHTPPTRVASTRSGECTSGSIGHRMGGTNQCRGFGGTTSTYEILDSGRQAKGMIWKP